MSQSFIAPFHNEKSLRFFKQNQYNQIAAVFWLTGLSGSGKSSLAFELDSKLTTLGKISIVLDGDDLRAGLNSNLGFSEVDRFENIRRTAYLAKTLVNNGLIVIVSLVSPTQEMRNTAKQIIGSEDFHEIFVDASIDVCIERDPKGFYKKALNGEIKDYTGVGSNYEKPLQPNLILQTDKFEFNDCIDQLFKYVNSKLQ